MAWVLTNEILELQGRVELLIQSLVVSLELLLIPIILFILEKVFEVSFGQWSQQGFWLLLDILG